MYCLFYVSNHNKEDIDNSPLPPLDASNPVNRLLLSIEKNI
jgi:hypothetical protein